MINYSFQRGVPSGAPQVPLPSPLSGGRGGGLILLLIVLLIVLRQAQRLKFYLRLMIFEFRLGQVYLFRVILFENKT